MIPSKTQRSLSVLREMNPTAMAPHAAYMKITTVELEKLRLSKAREHALHRIGEIDVRLRELEEQKTALLSCLGPARSGPAIGAGARGLRHNGGRVRLTY